MEGPIANQLIAWNAFNFGHEGGRSKSEFLRCLKDTKPGDRQVVWEASGGRGLVAVVDFGSEARTNSAGQYERWGRLTALDPPISVDQLVADPVVGSRFKKPRLSGLQGHAVRLTHDEGKAVNRLTNDLPAPDPPDDHPTGKEIEAIYSGKENLPPEKMIELLILEKKRLWRRLGFPERPTAQLGLENRKRPDLIAPGVVGDVKRRVRSNDGPGQVEGYVRELDRARPEEGPWRAILIHTVDDLDNAARQRIEASEVPIQVWCVVPGLLRKWKAVLLLDWNP